MIDFADKDPEDAYDAGDPPPVRLAVLIRVLTALDAEPDRDRWIRRRLDVVRLLRNIADELANGVH